MAAHHRFLHPWLAGNTREVEAAEGEASSLEGAWKVQGQGRRSRAWQRLHSGNVPGYVQAKEFSVHPRNQSGCCVN